MGDSDHETDDITIPRAAMNKMIKELCPQIRVANEARYVIGPKGQFILKKITIFVLLLRNLVKMTPAGFGKNKGFFKRIVYKGSLIL